MQHFPIPGLSIPYAAALLDHIIQLLNIKPYNGGSASSSFNLESISISWHGDEFIVMGDSRFKPSDDTIFPFAITIEDMQFRIFPTEHQNPVFFVKTAAKSYVTIPFLIYFPSFSIY